MTTKKAVILVSISFLAALSIVLFRTKQPPDHFSYQVFSDTGGWGYDILVNRDTLIHQAYIPAVAKMEKFKSKEDAEKVAILVLKKIEAKETPSVTRAEINQLGIR